jgi:hypothetical protein
MTTLIRAGLVGALLATSSLAGCASTYYGAMEQIGFEKRDLLVQRVTDAAVSQENAKVEFANALEAFRAVVDINGGDLESTYDTLSDAYDRSEDKADKVRARIREVKGVARDLFSEWDSELKTYSDPGLRRASAEQKAATAMDPVLAVFHDRVLFLKHNLNARAIASLGTETADLESDVADLIAEMERSIAEADAFIAEMRAGS